LRTASIPPPGPLHPPKALPSLADDGRGAQGRGARRQRSASRLRVDATRQLEQATAAEFSENQPPTLYHSQRLSELVKLRRVYRAVLGATYLLNLPNPLYEPSKVLTKGGKQPPPADEEELRQREEEQQQRAVQAIVAMYMTVEELQTSMQLLDPSYAELLQGPPGSKPQEMVEERVKEVTGQLLTRAVEEARRLPPEGEARLAAERDGWDPAQDAQGPLSDTEAMVGRGSGPLAAVVKGEQQLEKYIVKKVAPFVKSRVEISLQNPGWVVDSAKALQTYGAGLWERLNGKGSDGKTVKPSELGLPALITMKPQVDKQVETLLVEIDALEKKVQEASKARETRVRSAGLQSKARLAVELMAMDREVIDMSHTLGIRTLQLEMLYMYQTLEQEALEILEFSRATEQVVTGQSSAEELAIFVAEYGLLNSQLNELMGECVDGCCLIEDSEVKQLEVLSREIPDLRSRLGIGDGLVFGGGGFNFRRIQMSVKDSFGKIAEGVGFLITGFRVLGSDISYAFQIFLKAVRGRTLRPREVQALRRSVLDILAFIPFTIILIIPLSPVGHVLVFGFIQRYFPGLYPSQFTARRQEIMKRSAAAHKLGHHGIRRLLGG